ncbi:MAG: FKBP-type peptidyl-prolyl cis-trans isomerase [Bacteroidetes bacterium]|nr:FKBP-type peptidyl-prolyl cis-trans isomerase [Bacteroidota bacterium]
MSNQSSIIKRLTLFAYCLLPVACCLLSACSNSKFSDFEKTESGLLYKFHVKGKDTIHPNYGQVVRVKMAKRLADSTLESTNLMSPDGMEIPLREPMFKGAIEEGITMMSVGDSATFLMSTDSINKYFPSKDSTKKFKPNAFLAFDIKLMQIKTMEEMQREEDQKRQEYINDRKEKGPRELSRYIEDNHIDVKPTASGMYLIEKEKGKGLSPKDGDSVVVHYTGSFLDGTIFDSSMRRNEPFGFKVGAKQVIPGWEEALKLMKKGTAATIILPSSLAYDSTGYINRQTGKYFIPPYAPMKFDIQLLDIKTKK